MDQRHCFKIILVFIISVSICNALSPDDLQEEENKKIESYILPSQEALINQRTEVIRRIMQAKSLELQQPIDINDSILFKKCQQLSQLRNFNQESNIKDYIDRESIVDSEPDHNDTNYDDSNLEETIHKDVTPESVVMKIKPPEVLNQEMSQHQISTTEKIPITTSKTVNSTQQSSTTPNKVTTQQSSTTYNKVTTQKSLTQQQYVKYPYGNPFYYIYHHFFPEPKKIDPITTTTTTTTPEPPKPLYSEKLRFILRMPYPEPEKISKFPWEFDSFAYYPKNMQPDFINMAVPYTPTYHMIRRLIVPSKLPATYVVNTKP